MAVAVRKEMYSTRKSSMKTPVVQPNMAPSKTSSIRSDTSDHSEGKTKTLAERLNSDEIGLKIVEDPPSTQVYSGPRQSSSSTGSNGPAGGRSRSPAKHRIQVYEAHRRRSCRAVSPYLCEIARKADPKATFKEIYVSDAEFKLIQHALNVQTAAQRRAMNIRKTLFGYVYVQPPDSTRNSGLKNGNDSGQSSVRSNTSVRKSMSHASVAKKITSTNKSNRQQQKKVNHDESSGSNNANKAPLRFSKGSKKTAIQSTTSVPKNSVTTSSSKTSQGPSKASSSTQQWTQVQNDILKMISACSSPFERSKETLTEEVQVEQDADEDERSLSLEPPFPQDQSDPKAAKEENTVEKNDVVASTSDQDMKTCLFAAAETSMILMNTLFKDSLDDPTSSKLVTDLKLFQKFIDVESERDALAKAADLFDAAAKSIKNYLFPTDSKKTESEDSVSSSASSSPYKVISSADQDINRTMESKDDGTEVIAVDKTEEAVDVQNDCDHPNWNYCTDFNKKPFHVTVATSSVPGFLVQTIMCKDYEFNLQYIGNTRKISTLVSSTADRSKAITLTPHQLLDIIDRSVLATSARLSASKYHLQIASQQIGNVVQEYMEGKYGRYSKTLKKSNLKLQGLNTFAGIVLQISRVLSHVFRALLTASDIYSELSQILQAAPKSPENLQEKEVSRNETVEQLVKFIPEIENAFEIGKTSLAAIYSSHKASHGVKIKKYLRRIVEHMFESITQLQTHHDKDFASLVISGVCGSCMLITCTENLPTFDAPICRSVLTHLNTIEGNLKELSSVTNRTVFVSSYLASKSLQNLRNNRETARMIEEKKSQMKAVPWYKRKFLQRVLERTYSRISIPSPEQLASREDHGAFSPMTEDEDDDIAMTSDSAGPSDRQTL